MVHDSRSRGFPYLVAAGFDPSADAARHLLPARLVVEWVGACFAKHFHALQIRVGFQVLMLWVCPLNSRGTITSPVSRILIFGN
jgi:hypothetical protein